MEKEQVRALVEALAGAFRLVDGIAGAMNGVPNEPTDDQADVIAGDLADLLGVPFDENWPNAVATTLAADRASAGVVGEEIEDALALYRALSDVPIVYTVQGLRPATDVPFSWYVVGPDGEVAYCQTEGGEQHARMIAAALNDRVAMCALPANDAGTPQDVGGEG